MYIKIALLRIECYRTSGSGFKLKDGRFKLDRSEKVCLGFLLLFFCCCFVLIRVAKL